MSSIRKEVFINASPELVWDALRDVGALHTRLVPGFVTDTRLEPGARTVTFGNGQVVRELIVDLNEADRRLVWAVVDGPFQHYNASAQVFDAGQASCRFVWIADLLPDGLANDVAAMMEQGLSVIKRTMEASGARGCSTAAGKESVRVGSIASQHVPGLSSSTGPAKKLIRLDAPVWSGTANARDLCDGVQ